MLQRPWERMESLPARLKIHLASLDCVGEELEVLNRALAKALRIRQTHCNVLEAELVQPGATEGSSTVPESGRDSTKQPAVAGSDEKRSDKLASVKVDGVGAQEMASRSRSSDGLRGKRIATCPVFSRRPLAADLKAPYKTELVGRRRLASLAKDCLSRGVIHRRSRAGGNAVARLPDHSASVRGAVSRSQCGRLHTLTSTHRRCSWHQAPTAAHPNTDHTPPFTPVSQQFVESIKESMQAGTWEGDVPQSDSSHVEPPKPFMLQASGSSLELPAAWRKQRSRNTCLWGKVSKSKATDVQERARFMERVESAFHSQLPTVSNAEIEQQLDNIYDLCRSINQCLDTDPLLYSPDAVGWKQECDRVQTLEICQETLPSLHHQLQQLKGAATRWKNLGGGWRPALTTCRFVGSEGAPLLLYCSLQELKQMETLRFQVQTLQQHIHIQRAMAEELLPLLLSPQSSDQSHRHLYRAVYSLLCEGGERFPALVLDNIPD
ncbi:uncharacterized protein tedc2 isoform X2 [Rhinoraja longicauda]